MSQHHLPIPSSRKDLSKLHRVLRQAGWETQRMGNEHHKLIAPNGQVVTHSSTPSDYRAGRKILADLKRTGAAPFCAEIPLSHDAAGAADSSKPTSLTDTAPMSATMTAMANPPLAKSIPAAKAEVNHLPALGRAGVSVHAGKLTLAFNGVDWWNGRAVIDLDVPSDDEARRGAAAVLLVTFSDRDSMISGSRSLIKNGKGFRIEFASSRISGGESLVRQRSVRQADYASTATCTRILLPKEFLVETAVVIEAKSRMPVPDTGDADQIEQNNVEAIMAPGGTSTADADVAPPAVGEDDVNDTPDDASEHVLAETSSERVSAAPAGQDNPAAETNEPAVDVATQATDTAALAEVSELLSVDLMALTDLKKAIATVNALKARLGDKVSLEVSKDTGLLRGQVLIDAEL